MELATYISVDNVFNTFGMPKQAAQTYIHKTQQCKNGVFTQVAQKKGRTSFLKGNPWIRSLHPGRAAFNTRIIKIKSGACRCAGVSRIKVKPEKRFVDFREECITLNADALAKKLFRGF
jgi:hypothetical protein